MSKHILNAHSNVRVRNGNHGFIVWENIAFDRDNSTTKPAYGPTRDVSRWKNTKFHNLCLTTSSMIIKLLARYLVCTAEHTQIRWRQCSQRERCTLARRRGCAINGTWADVVLPIRPSGGLTWNETLPSPLLKQKRSWRGVHHDRFRFRRDLGFE